MIIPGTILFGFAAWLTAVFCSESVGGPLAPCGWGKKAATFLVILVLMFFVGACMKFAGCQSSGYSSEYDEMDRFR